jgi:O-antigen/teichoic acid export membrane protein
MEKSERRCSKRDESTRLGGVTSSKTLVRLLVRNATWNVLGYGAFIILSFVSTPLYIHFLGVQQYGLLVLLNALLIPLGLLNVGFGQATVKYVAESYGNRNRGEAAAYVRTTLLLNMAVGVVGAVAISVSARFLTVVVFKVGPSIQQLAQTAVIWCALGWLASQSAITFIGVPTALQKYNVVSLGNTIYACMNIIVGLLALAMGGDLLLLVQTRFGCGLIAASLWGLLARKLLDGESLWPRFNMKAFHKTFRFSIWQTVAGVGGLLGGQTDKFLLGMYISTEAVGLYNVAHVIYQVAYGVISKLGEVVFPAISNLEGEGEQERLVGLMLRSSWVLAILISATMGSIYIYSHDLLRLYLGDDIADSSNGVLKVLSFAAIVSAPSIGVLQYLLGTGNTAWTALTAVVSGILTLFFGLFLVPSFGLLGAAWSNLLAVILSRPPIHLFIWRGRLRKEVTRSLFVTSLYGPVMVLMPVVAILGPVYTEVGWRPGWLGLVMGFSSCLFLLCAISLFADRLLPGGENRRRDFMVFVNGILGVVQRSLGLRMS